MKKLYKELIRLKLTVVEYDGIEPCADEILVEDIHLGMVYLMKKEPLRTVKSWETKELNEGR